MEIVKMLLHQGRQLANKNKDDFSCMRFIVGQTVVKHAPVLPQGDAKTQHDYCVSTLCLAGAKVHIDVVNILQGNGAHVEKGNN